ncbi:hypothetical protein N8J89_08030 [Crossiella sp. CA-258035]|uniref:hypothetical protein n=1 Tax=Crossiella sp. CA-258035 TaxID=2981138 RepID=UPI0024BCCFFD|nr:hypothetical protein [Crossiella sp. CA-258035]WHT21003.1 hypothetical protein N8J89_08030 [Crossiella sp. CA-258035]
MPGARLDDGQIAEAIVQFNPGEMSDDEKAWRAEIQRVTGFTIPEHRQVELKDTRYWGDPQTPYIYCRFTITDRDTSAERLDVEDLVKAVKAVRRKAAPKAAGTGRALIVAWADLQFGKAGSRGDSEDLVNRVLSKLDALDGYAKETCCDSAYLVDVGDCVESFENVPSQAFTNDLSFPEQLRLARRMFTEAAMRLARSHAQVTCVGVPSNHGRWRKGKDQLGRPGDDYGIETLVAVSDAFALNPDAFGHVQFVVPDVWEETVALDVNGTILAVTHGHQVGRPEQIPNWWAQQVHGGQPAADADILLTGHFHSVRVQPSGRSAHTGRAKWFIQAPTLDNGSDWYRLKYGADSDPALMVFTVDANGWDNLRLL